MIRLGPRTGGISDCEAKEHADRWGCDPMHPSAAAYRKISEDTSEDLSNAEARYTNPVKATIKLDSKRPRVDYSLQRVDWVAGCPAALPRRDRHRVLAPGEERPLGATNYQEGEASSTAEAGLSVASVGCGAGEAGGKALRKKSLLHLSAYS
jgi:hypothetical protein